MVSHRLPSNISAPCWAYNKSQRYLWLWTLLVSRSSKGPRLTFRPPSKIDHLLIVESLDVQYRQNFDVETILRSVVGSCIAQLC